jgi:Arc/MetJ-type ribon-helix-helix transcriptional regulator
VGQMGAVVRQMFDAPISVSKSPSWMDYPVPECPCQVLSIWEDFSMERRAARARDARIGVRVSVQDQHEIEETARARGYTSPSSFIRTAIRNELHGREELTGIEELHGREELTGIEERIRGSFERLSNENFRLSRTLQALFALVDALSKTVLTCVPEPPAEAKPQAVALARERYHRLIKSAGAAMSGDSYTTMKDILSHDSER